MSTAQIDFGHFRVFVWVWGICHCFQSFRNAFYSRAFSWLTSNLIQWHILDQIWNRSSKLIDLFRRSISDIYFDDLFQIELSQRNKSPTFFDDLFQIELSQWSWCWSISTTYFRLIYFKYIARSLVQRPSSDDLLQLGYEKVWLQPRKVSIWP